MFPSLIVIGSSLLLGSGVETSLNNSIYLCSFSFISAEVGLSLILRSYSSFLILSPSSFISCLIVLIYNSIYFWTVLICSPIWSLIWSLTSNCWVVIYSILPTKSCCMFCSVVSILSTSLPSRDLISWPKSFGSRAKYSFMSTVTLSLVALSSGIGTFSHLFIKSDIFSYILLGRSSSIVYIVLLKFWSSFSTVSNFSDCSSTIFLTSATKSYILSSGLSGS